MTTTTTNNNTLRVRIGEASETKDQFRDRLAAMESGEDVEEMHVLNLESMEAVEQLFRATNIEILEKITQEEPSSIRETAELVGRGHKEVLRNMDELEQLGLIEFEQDGRAKRPQVKYTTFEIEMTLDGSLSSNSVVTA